MKSICLYFQVHQPFRLRTYRFFDIGVDHYYFDDYQNKSIVKRIAEKCYLPANEMLLQLIKSQGKNFKVAFSISGTALEQFERYTPEVIDSFKKLAKTGNVEFLAETYSHSLTGLGHPEAFKNQVERHVEKIQALFGKKPTVFRNTELIYSNDIAGQVYNMGFTAMLTEGAKQVLGWKSPNFVYHSAPYSRLKLLLRNYQLSDDIAFRFSQHEWSQWPLTAEKYISWLNSIDKTQEIVNIFMDYETFGEHQKADTGIFEFMKALIPMAIKSGKWTFKTPSEIVEDHKSVAGLDVQHAISWADEERDLTAWLGNDLQDDAFGSLYENEQIMANCTDEDLLRDYMYLQASDHFYYMCTKWFSDGAVHHYFNPFSSPYEAFLNYMNVLADFSDRVKRYAEKPGMGGIVPKPISAGKPVEKKVAPAATKKAVKAKPAPKKEEKPKVVKKVVKGEKKK